MSTELAFGVITNLDSSILLLHQSSPQGLWELPGGEVKLGESPAETVQRATREVLGVEVLADRELYRQDFARNGLEYECRWLAAMILRDGRPYPQQAKYDKCQFYTVFQLRQLDMLAPNMRNILKKVVDGDFTL